MARSLALTLAIGAAATASLAAGCASTSTGLRARIRDATDASHAPRTEAALARVRAAEAQRGAHEIVPRAQVLLNDLSPDSVAAGGGPAVTGRVWIEAPWNVALGIEADEARVEQAVGELESASLDDRALACLRGVRAAQVNEAQAVGRALLPSLDALAAWNEAFAQSGAVDELDAARTRITLARVRGELAGVGSTDPPTPLPELSAPEGTLVRDSARVEAWIEAHHPRPAALLAQARRYDRLAERERLRAVPWMDWAQARVPFDSTNVGDTELGVAVSLPLDTRSGATSESMDWMEESAELDAAAATQLLGVSAREALFRLARFEERLPALRALAASADGTDATATSWLAQHLGRPRDVVDAILDSFHARITILEARAEAASASCDLLAATGSEVGAWPRE